MRYKACLIVALSACAMSTAQAALITFVHSGVAIGGTLDGVSFDAGAFTITATADTNDVQAFPHGFIVEHSEASIVIGGVGVLEFITPTETFVNNVFDVVGFSRVTGPGGIDLFNGPYGSGAFGSYDLTTSIGTVAGEGSVLQWGNGDVLTNQGVLFLTDVDGTLARFSAITSVPLPGGALLMPGCIALLLAVRRRG